MGISHISRSSLRSLSRLIFLVILSSAVTSTAAGSSSYEYDDIEILSLTDAELIFRYSPSFQGGTSDIASDDGEFEIDRCAVNREMGEARVPIRKVIVGVPLEGSPEVTLLSASYDDIAPREVETNRSFETSPYDNAQLLRARVSARYPVLETVPPYFIRDQRVIEIHINPVKLTSYTKVSSVAEEITVSVKYNTEDASSFRLSNDRAFEKIYEASLLNYDQAASWRGRKLASSWETSGSPFSMSSNWIKVGVMNSGMYRITPSDLEALGLNVSSIDPRTFRVFWRGGRQLPVRNADPRPEFREIAIKVSGEADGSFDSGDNILFYMRGADFVDIDSSMSFPRHVKNAYTANSYVWLTFDGQFSDDPLRMRAVSVPPLASAYQFHDRFRPSIHFEENRFLSVGAGGYIYDYYTWFWEDEEDYTLNIQLDDFEALEACTLLVKSVDHEMSVEVNGREYGSLPHYEGRRKFYVENFRDGANVIEFHQERYGSYSPLLDNFDIIYSRTLSFSDQSLDFYLYHYSDSTYRYSLEHLAGSVNDIEVFAINDAYDQAELIDYDVSLSNVEFDWVAEQPGFQRFVISTASSAYSPSSMRIVSPVDIRSYSDGDVIVVAPPNFLSALDGYKTYRQQSGEVVSLVSLEDIYNDFSGGLIDPLAIRDFFKYCFETSGRRPSAALLVGDGHYDFRGYLGRDAVNYVPPFVVENDENASDENYVHFGAAGMLDSDTSYSGDIGVDMVIARWPVRSSGEVSAYIEKLESYEQASNYGPWRNSVTFVADDEFKSGRRQSDESVHTQQSENLANYHTPAMVDAQKVYLTDYPFDSFNQKPKARARVIQSVNDGTALINYIGHGNPDLWADERAFYWKEDLYKLTNQDRLAVVFNASCSIGQFDSPLREAMAEEFFRYNNGGAIATIAATRQVYSTPNAQFAYKAFDLLFGPEDYSLCEVVYVTKLLRQIPIGGPIANDRLYVVFGDPLMRFGMPDRDIVIESVDPPTLSALSLTTVTGYVSESDGGVDTDFNGDVYISVLDAVREKDKDLDDGGSLSYVLPGPKLFRGKSTVESGRFEMQFVVPKDVSYGESSAKVLAYAFGGSAQASGAVDSIEVSGTNPSITDTIGPTITVRRVSGEVFESGLLNAGETLTVELFDSSGINLSGEVGHGIEVVFDDDPFNDMDLTEVFTYYPGSYRSGELEFQVPDLTSGSHTMKVKAWDSANNSSMAVYNVALGEAGGLSISDITNYPNPATASTRFSYHLSEAVSSVRIDVYSLRGRLIMSLRHQPSNAGYNLSSVWDIRDGVGDRLANGVYIYKVTAAGSLTFASSNPDAVVSGFGKLVVLR